MSAPRKQRADARSHYDPPRMESVCSEIKDERWRQECKVQTGRIPWDCADPGVDDDRKLAVLGEEFGEVARALIEGDGLRAELIQVAAVALAWAESLTAERRAGSPSAAAEAGEGVVSAPGTNRRDAHLTERRKLDGKQEPFEGQAASAAPSITGAEPPRGDASGQGTGSLAADRNADGSPPLSGHRSTPYGLWAALKRAHGWMLVRGVKRHRGA